MVKFKGHGACDLPSMTELRGHMINEYTDWGGVLNAIKADHWLSMSLFANVGLNGE